MHLVVQVTGRRLTAQDDLLCIKIYIYFNLKWVKSERRDQSSYKQLTEDPGNIGSWEPTLVTKDPGNMGPRNIEPWEHRDLVR